MYALYVPRGLVSYDVVAAYVAVAIKVFENAQSLDRPARNALQSGPLVNVVEEYVAVVEVAVGLVHYGGRQLARLDRNGLEEVSAVDVRLHESHVVECVDKVYPRRPVAVVEYGGDNIFFGERIRVYEVRIFSVHEPVLYLRLVHPTVGREFVNPAPVLYGALRDVEEVQFALARSAVVP